MTRKKVKNDEKELNIDDLSKSILNHEKVLISYSSTWPGANFGILCSIILLEIFMKMYTIFC